MANINSLIAQVNQKLSQSPLFFVAPVAERAMGLESLLENYYVISSSHDYYSNRPDLANKIKVFENAGTTASLLEKPEVINFINSVVNPQIRQASLEFFKQTSDSTVDEFAQKNNFQLLRMNNSATLTRQIENKINQYQILSESEIKGYLPDTLITNLSSMNTDFPEYVVQTPFGHTGESTFVIDQDKTDQEKLNQLAAEKPNLQCKVTRLIPGDAYTINACNYDQQTYMGGLSYQYTGVPSLTALRFATVGNDWKLPEGLLSEAQKQEIMQITGKIGMHLRETFGFKGMFGIDFVIEKGTGKIYLIEINPRQTASVSMFTKLQLQKEQIPLSLLHICEFLDIREGIDFYEYNAAAIQPFEASQVILRSESPDGRFIPETSIKSGVYRQMSDNAAREKQQAGQAGDILFLDNTEDRPLIWQQDFNSVTDFGKDGLGITTIFGTEVQFNSEIARVQAHRSLAQVIDGEVKLLPLASDCLHQINDNLK